MSFIGEVMLNNIIALSILIDNHLILNQIIKNYSDDEITKLLKGEWFLSDVDSSIQSKLSNENKNIDALKTASDILKKNNELGITTITILDEAYPSNLKKQADCPTVLYIKGNFQGDVYKKSLGCVGTRSPSVHGIRAVNALVPEWTKEDCVIVAGLAKGIDSESHKSCLANGGITIAVLGHGLDMIYPQDNKNLADDIIKNDGLLISEYPVGVKPQKYFFVNRNKIISGLSEALIVFEAKLNSGTMHTVKYALEENKYIFCPLPVDMDIVEVEAIKYLLETKKAFGIKNRYEFYFVLDKLGYTLKEKTLKSIQRQKNFQMFFENFQITMKSNTNFQKEKKTIQIGIDEDFYQLLLNFANEKGMDVQDIFNMLIINGRNRHE
jgi:DNA processing protein